MTSFSRTFLDNSIKTITALSTTPRSRVCGREQDPSARLNRGRLFLCGSGGGAGHASHAACDFRKLARIESYAVTDNVSELTTRASMTTAGTPSYSEWFPARPILASHDCLFVFSVGGGSPRRGISVNLVRAMGIGTSRSAPRSSASPAATVAKLKATCPTACVLVPDPRRSDSSRRRRKVFQALDLAPRRIAFPAWPPATAKWESVSEAAFDVIS